MSMSPSSTTHTVRELAKCAEGLHMMHGEHTVLVCAGIMLILPSLVLNLGDLNSYHHFYDHSGMCIVAAPIKRNDIVWNQ